MATWDDRGSAALVPRPVKADVLASPGVLVEDILTAIQSMNTTRVGVDDRDIVNARLLARALWAAGWRKKA